MYEHRIVKCKEKKSKIAKTCEKWEWTVGNSQVNSAAVFCSFSAAII